LGVSVDQESALASQIFTNNIAVTFYAFSGGLLLGIGTVYVLLQFGVLVGVVAGLAVGSGNGRVFFELVTAHGVLELSCIIVAGAAGVTPLGAWWRAPDRGLYATAESTYAAGQRGCAIGFKGALCLVDQQVEPLNRAYG